MNLKDQYNPYAQISIIADRISKIILEKNKNMQKIRKPEGKWHPLPEINPQMLSLATVDGGSRIIEKAGVHIYYAQAAGRTLSTENPQDWISSRDGGIVLQKRLGQNLVKLSREILELEVANELIKDTQPKYLLVDGTLKGIFVLDRSMTSLLQSSKKSKYPLNAEFTQSILNDIDFYKDKLIKYGKVLEDLFHNVKKHKTTIVGLAKDSYSQEFVPELLKELELSDSSYFSFVSQGTPGMSNLLYSKFSKIPEEKKEKEINMIRSIPEKIREFWDDEGITFPNRFNVFSFYAITIQNGQPIRIDYHSPRDCAPDQIIRDLLPYSDGRDWFIPPRLSHEYAVVKNDLFDSFTKQIFHKVAQAGYEVASLYLGRTRRERTQ